MTVDPGWRELFEAVAHVPGPRKERLIRDATERIVLATTNTLHRTLSDVAVGLGAVDTGEGFDPQGWLADYAAVLPDTIIEKFLPGAGSGAEGAGVALGSAAQTMIGLVQDVQALQQAQSAGKSFVINYADYADGESETVGVPLDLDYSGTGSGRSVIVNGVSTWNRVADGDVQVLGRYNGPNNDGLNTDTDTDYQVLQATAKGPMDIGAEESFCARESADKQSRVYIRGYRPSLFSFRCELGCYVAGVKTVFATDVPAGFSLNLAMLAGDLENADPYRFRVFSGNSLIVDYTDTDEVSALGSGFRGWGFYAATADGGNAIPASASRVQCADAA